MPDPTAAGRTANRVREIAVPPDARALCTLSRIDYENAVLADTPVAPGRTGEQWARAVLEGAPAQMREALTAGWSQLGLRLGPARSDRHVLGWAVRHSSPDSVLLGTESTDGLRGELLVERREGALLFASFIQQDSDEARAMWAGVEDLHAPVMCRLVEEAVARASA